MLKKLIKTLFISLTLVSVSIADLIPQNPHVGDKYIKVTVSRRGPNGAKYVRFQNCRISQKEIQSGEFQSDDNNSSCSSIHDQDGRTWFSQYRLRRIRRSLERRAKIGVGVGIFLAFLTFGQAGKDSLAADSLREEVITDKDIIIMDTDGLSIEEEDRIAANPRYETSDPDFFRGDLGTALQDYSETYQRVLPQERETRSR